MDREARSRILDADPAFGQLREPLLKVIHAMRSMEVKSKAKREIEFRLMADKIGQWLMRHPMSSRSSNQSIHLLDRYQSAVLCLLNLSLQQD